MSEMLQYAQAIQQAQMTKPQGGEEVANALTTGLGGFQKGYEKAPGLAKDEMERMMNLMKIAEFQRKQANQKMVMDMYNKNNWDVLESKDAPFKKPMNFADKMNYKIFNPPTPQAPAGYQKPYFKFDESGATAELYPEGGVTKTPPRTYSGGSGANPQLAMNIQRILKAAINAVNSKRAEDMRKQGLSEWKIQKAIDPNKNMPDESELLPYLRTYAKAAKIDLNEILNFMEENKQPTEETPGGKKVPTGKKMSPEIAQGYWKKAGGDKQKAIQMAIQDGYDPYQ